MLHKFQVYRSSLWRVNSRSIDKPPACDIAGFMYVMQVRGSPKQQPATMQALVYRLNAS